MASVSLQNVEKTYPGGQRAVSGFSLDVGDAEFVVFVGPSGCGKSTMLRCIAGLEDVTAGTIHIGDRLVNDVPPKDRDIAMVFQNYALYPHMTVFENMAFALKLRKWPRPRIAEKVGRAAEILGLGAMLDRKPRTLSGGQRQRVALGRAIVRDPQCFLFDEPLSNLDAKLRGEMRAEIKRLHLELGSTTIYVTHDQEEAMTLGDRLVVMKDGVVQQCGAPLDVYRRPQNRFVASFVGTPPMNLLEGSIVRDEGRLCFDEGDKRLILPRWAESALERRVGSRVVMGLRPHALRVASRHGEGGALEMRVDIVEPLGDKMDVHLSTAHHARIVAHVDAGAPLRPNETVSVCIDPDLMHFFETGDVGARIAGPD
jgi:multiple sugar transport system ATP-binding protein